MVESDASEQAPELSPAGSPAGSSEQAKSNNSRRFSSDEVADIIRLSLQDENRNSENSIDHEELVSIGKEVGVGQAQIDRAVGLLEDEHQTKDKERLLWLRFKGHCFTFVLVNLLCIFINIFTGTESFWAGYVLFGTGLFLLGHYAGLRYAPDFVEMATERTRMHAFNSPKIEVASNASVSFTVSDPSGLMQSEGMVYVNDGKLHLEYQTSDSFFGLLKSSIKYVEIDLADITQSCLKHKFWSSELVLQGRSMRIFGNAPGSSSGTLSLNISKQYHNAALNLLSQLKP
ncbi:MAG: hypothetical protein ACJA2Q_000191 [Pseudohongiellaceae bacterium]|jgi:hypothetical protein